MSRYVFKLPDLGEGMVDAEIAVWHVELGDKVGADQPLVDIMTDKATVEIAAPVSGVVAARHGEVGDKRAVGAPLVEFETEADADDEAHRAPEPKEPLASPAVRRRARERGIDLRGVHGTGPDGRVTMEDLDRHDARDQPSDRTVDFDEVKVIGLRREIARKMQDAARRIPHFGYVEEVDMTEFEALREGLNANRRADQQKLTPLPLLIRAVAQILPQFPEINARFDDEAGLVRRYRPIHVGIATQTPAGLMVPVLFHADTKDVWTCAREIARLAAASRAGGAKREELSGSTITITSLGALGGIAASPIINHPEVAILCPNRIVEHPVARDGQIAVRTLMNISSAFDHRVVDGHDAARFIRALKMRLESPSGLDAV